MVLQIIVFSQTWGDYNVFLNEQKCSLTIVSGAINKNIIIIIQIQYIDRDYIILKVKVQTYSLISNTRQPTF